MTDGQLLRSLADKEEIRDCVYRYSRGIDRFVPIRCGGHWPDVQAGSAPSRRRTEGFIGWAFPDDAGARPDLAPYRQYPDPARRRSGDRQIGLRELSGGWRSTARNATRPAAAAAADRFERRGSEWRIAKRLVVVDWSRPLPPSADLAAMPAALDGPAGRQLQNGSARAEAGSAKDCLGSRAEPIGHQKNLTRSVRSDMASLRQAQF